MAERMEAIDLLNKFMTEGPDTFPAAMGKRLIELIPLSDKPFRKKAPYFGKTRDEGNVEGFVAGFGNVTIRDGDSTSQLKPDPGFDDTRFGLWEVQHFPTADMLDAAIFIDHMWSHHAHSGFAKRSALFRYGRYPGNERFLMVLFSDNPHLRKLSDDVPREELEALITYFTRTIEITVPLWSGGITLLWFVPCVIAAYYWEFVDPGPPVSMTIAMLFSAVVVKETTGRRPDLIALTLGIWIGWALYWSLIQ